MRQQTLDGSPAPRIGIDRVHIKVAGPTRSRLQRSAILRNKFSMIEIVEMSTKLAVIVLNKLTEEDIREILQTDDPGEILKTISKLFY